jgi:hypothetical protein
MMMMMMMMMMMIMNWSGELRIEVPSVFTEQYLIKHTDTLIFYELISYHIIIIIIIITNIASLLLLYYGSHPSISALSVDTDTQSSTRQFTETYCRRLAECVIINCVFMFMLIIGIAQQLSVNTRFFPTLVI